MSLYRCMLYRGLYSRLLTHWRRDKWLTLYRRIYKIQFSCLKIVSLLTFRCKLFPMVQLAIYQHCFLYWFDVVDQATGHYRNQWWPGLLTNLYVRPWRVKQNSLVCLLQTINRWSAINAILADEEMCNNTGDMVTKCRSLLPRPHNRYNRSFDGACELSTASLTGSDK